MTDASISTLGRALRDGSLSAVDLVEATFERIDGAASLNAFTHLTRDRALRDAARADHELRHGRDRGPLHGIPYAVKELVDVAGIPTTGQSRLPIPAAAGDADVVQRLEAAGAVLVGKTTTYELGIEPRPSDDGPFPPARNPHHPGHVTGGSSSGSAAAVAAGLVPFTIGTDTGGSIRGPAAYCGIVGLKPTYGRVSCRGVLPLSFSLDHAGPLAANVHDVALAFDALAHTDCAATLTGEVTGLRIGYARSWHANEADAAITTGLDAAAQAFAGLGAIIQEVDLPDPGLLDAVATVILQAEAFAIHRATLASHPGAYGRAAYRHLAAGAVLSAADLVQAHRLRRSLTLDFHAHAFANADVLLTANVLGTAPRFDEAGKRNAFRVFPFNVTGHPALAVPVGLAADGLPFGMQLVGRPSAEAVVCRAGDAYQRHVYSPARPAHA